MIHDLLRDTAEPALLAGPFAHLLVEGSESGFIRVQRRHVLHAPADYLHVAISDGVLERGTALLALDDHLNPTRHPLHLRDPGDSSDPKQRIGVGLLDLGVFLSDGEDALVAGDRGFDRLERHLPTGGDRRRHGGERDGAPKRNHRKADSFAQRAIHCLRIAVGFFGRCVGPVLVRADLLHLVIRFVSVVQLVVERLAFFAHSVFPGLSGASTIFSSVARNPQLRRSHITVHYGRLHQLEREGARARSSA